MLRVVKGSPTTLVLPTDKPATSGTITVVRDRDNTTLVNAQAVTIEAEQVTYALAAQTSEANLTVTWTIVNADGTTTIADTIEVCSNRAVSLDELRRYKPLDDTRRYSDRLLDTARTALENELEQTTGVSFTGREFNVTVDGNGTGELFLPVGRPRSISKVTIDGSTISANDLAAITVDERAGILVRNTAWTLGRRNITVTGVCGYKTPPGQVPFAIAKGVRYMLIDSPIMDRAISTTNEDGTTSSLVVAGVRGAMFSIPELNTVATQYATNFGVA